MDTTADIVVIGGGIAGLGAAAWMAPRARVIVLERESVTGYHATGRSAAMFIRNYGNATLRALNAASEAALVAPDALIADSSLLSPRGALMIAGEAETGALDAWLSGATGAAEIPPDDAVRLFPILRRAPIRRAAFEPTARDIDVDRLVQGCARALRHHGGSVVTGAEARSLHHAGGVWRVGTAAGTFSAPVVVNAAGAWADIVARRAGVRSIGLTPLRRSAAILPAPPGHDVARWPMAMSAGETWYAKPEAGMLLVSPADEDPVEAQDAWPDDMVLAEGLDRFERATTVPLSRVVHRWAGLRSFVADRTPVAGFAPDAPGFFWLAAQGGYGVQTAPALSRLAADLCLGASPDHLSAATVAALSPARLTAPSLESTS